MILTREIDGNRREDAQAARLTRNLSELGIPDSTVTAQHIEELANGVSAYLAACDGGPHRVGQLASRALTVLGRSDLARHLLLYEAGLITRRCSCIATDGEVWVLDLGRLQAADSEQLDLFLLPSLGILLDTTAHVWDGTGGNGVFGLKNLRVLAHVFGGPGAGSRRIRRFCSEMKDFCEDKLEQLQRQHGWSARPQLLVMDHR